MSSITDADVLVALQAACLQDTPESRKDMRRALEAVFRPQMSGTPTSFYSDPLRDRMNALITDCFAIEQASTAANRPEVRHALFRARCAVGEAVDVLRRLHQQGAHQ